MVLVGLGLHVSVSNLCVPLPLLKKNANHPNLLRGYTDADKANRLDVANAVNPLPKEEDKKLVIVKTPNAVNPLVWDYSVSV